MEKVTSYFEKNLELSPTDEELDGLDILSLYIAIAKKSSSEFKPYIDALPRDFPTILENWPATLKKFMTSDLLEKYETNIEDRRSRWRRVSKILGDNEPKVSETEFNTAYWSVFTRMKEEPCPEEDTWPEWFDVAHNEGKCSALAPVFDMMNHHNTDYNCDWDHSDGAKITTLRKINAGEELLINYGHEANSDLLSLYGFTIDNNQSPVKFSDEEMVLACVETQGLNERVCQTRIEYFLAYFDVEKLELSSACEVEYGDVKSYLIGEYDDDNEKQKIHAEVRWKLFMSSMIYRRLLQVNSLAAKLKQDSKWSNSQFGDMLETVYRSEKLVLEPCNANFEIELTNSIKSLFVK